MTIFPTVWDVLHDGSITAVCGAIPGTVRVEVSIDYLRERFPEPGKAILVLLSGCTRFAYREFEDSMFTTDLPAIARLKPEILSAKTSGTLSEIDCVKGVLEVAASDCTLALDGGRAITLDELLSVAEAYWTEWDKRAKQKQ